MARGLRPPAGGDHDRAADHGPRRLRRRRGLLDRDPGPHPARARRRLRLADPGPARGRLRPHPRRPSTRLAERGTALLLTADCGIGSVDEVGAALDAGIEVDRHRPSPARRRAARLPDPASRRSPATRSRSCARPASPTSSRPRSAARRRPRPSSTSSRSRRSPTWCRCAARTGPWSGAGSRSPGAPGGPGCGRCWPRPRSRRSASTRATSPSASGPRINAAGRLYRADAGVELMLTGDERRATEIAAELERANGERRQVEQRRARGGRARPRRALAGARRGARAGARGRGLAPGRGRDRRLADRRAPRAPGGADRPRRRRQRAAARAAASRASTCSRRCAPATRT